MLNYIPVAARKIGWSARLGSALVVPSQRGVKVTVHVRSKEQTVHLWLPYIERGGKITVIEVGNMLHIWNMCRLQAIELSTQWNRAIPQHHVVLKFNDMRCRLNGNEGIDLREIHEEANSLMKMEEESM